MDNIETGRLGQAGHLRLNGELVSTDDPIIQVREALIAAGLAPPSEYQTILVERGRTHLLMSEDKLVLTDHPHASLRAFLSDESFGFTVNEVSQVWGTDTMEVDEFLSIWPPPAGHDWVLERDKEPDTILRSGSSISFGPRGVEHIVSRPHHAADKLLVLVATLSGLFPAEGAARVRRDEAISAVLARAATALGLVDTSGWVVSVGGRDVNAAASFAQAGLSGLVELEWMPREGGGGHA